jgi:heat shock protein HslJ
MLAGALVMLALVVTGCRSAPPVPDPAAGLVGTSWRAEQIDGGAPDAAPATLRFDTATRVSGRASCNQYSAALTLAGDRMRVEQARTTRMACPPPVMDQERRFLAALAAVVGLRRDGERLLLLDEGGRVRLVLGPAPAAGAAIDQPIERSESRRAAMAEEARGRRAVRPRGRGPARRPRLPRVRRGALGAALARTMGPAPGTRAAGRGRTR